MLEPGKFYSIKGTKKVIFITERLEQTCYGGARQVHVRLTYFTNDSFPQGDWSASDRMWPEPVIEKFVEPYEE